MIPSSVWFPHLRLAYGRDELYLGQRIIFGELFFIEMISSDKEYCSLGEDLLEKYG